MRRREKGAPVWAVTLCCACLYALSLGRGFYASDGDVMFLTTSALATESTLALTPDAALPQIVAGQGGCSYSKYDPGLPLLAVPFFIAGDRLAALNEAHRTQVAATAVLLLPALAGAGAVTALYALARRLFGAGRGLTVALAAALATPLWPYSRMLFAESVLACALTASVALIVRASSSRRALVAAGAVFGVGVLTRAALAIYALPLAWLLASASADRGLRAVAWRWVAFALGALPFALGLLAHNALRFGDPLRFGYAGEGFTAPLLEGVAGLLLSPGKSALIYAPPLALAALLGRRFWRSERALAGFLALAWGVALIFYGAWWAWHGGWSWGPRFLVPLLPLSCLPLGVLPMRRGWRAALAVALALGAAVTALGVLTDPVAPYAGASVSGGTDYDAIHWQFESSPVAIAVERLAAGQTEPLALFHLSGGGLPHTWTVGVPLVALLGLALGAAIIVRAVWRAGSSCQSRPRAAQSGAKQPEQ